MRVCIWLFVSGTHNETRHISHSVLISYYNITHTHIITKTKKCLMCFSLRWKRRYFGSLLTPLSIPSPFYIAPNVALNRRNYRFFIVDSKKYRWAKLHTQCLRIALRESACINKISEVLCEYMFIVKNMSLPSTFAYGRNGKLMARAD